MCPGRTRWLVVVATLLATGCTLLLERRPDDGGPVADADVEPGADADADGDADTSCSDSDAAGCECPAGYSGTPPGCVDVNECLSDPCDENARCTNFQGWYECECRDGFTGDGTTCNDVDECASAPCDPNADCINQPGSFSCDCREGYSGDGYQCTVEATLRTLRVEMPCTSGHRTDACDVSPYVEDVATMGGQAGVIYSVAFRIRGVVEIKSYEGGVEDGYWSAGGTYSATDEYNTASLEISEPYQLYYLNSGESGDRHCVSIDHHRVLQVAAGATVRVVLDSVNDVAIINIDSSGTPIVVPDIPPAPDAFNGQFIQVDVESISR